LGREKAIEKSKPEEDVGRPSLFSIALLCPAYESDQAELLVTATVRLVSVYTSTPRRSGRSICQILFPGYLLETAGRSNFDILTS